MQVEITIYFIRNIEWEIGLVVGNYMYIYYICISIYTGRTDTHSNENIFSQDTYTYALCLCSGEYGVSINFSLIFVPNKNVLMRMLNISLNHGVIAISISHI